MAIEAPYSKYNKNNFKIWIFLCLGAAVIFAYDGYLSKYEWSFRRSFYDEHVIDGKPDGDMIFNQKSPLAFVGLAAILTVWFYARKNKKLIANDNELILADDTKVPYGSIQKINKTYFDSKGHFTFTYKNEDGKEIDKKLNCRQYDNLKEILELLVAKIS
jgi:cbb3-type cytochrome oxidase subunit 3